jgi:glucosyl-dolichyl phosphate glucuronosyltransferase
MLSETLNSRAPVLSVVLCTVDRAQLLVKALDALLAQVLETPAYEVVVVDNNSTDATPEVVRPFLASGRVRYELEPTQGLSVARNRGASVARADLIAFTDDDVRVSSTWVRDIVRAFTDDPDLAMVGGKVEPEWEGVPPPWLPAAGYAPLALVDYGEQPFRVAVEQPVCLIGANVAVRRSAFERAGGFSPALQRVRDGIGSTEDYDFERRLLADGLSAIYDPAIVVHAVVPRERLRKQYYRAWHSGHGRFYAVMRDPLFERSRFGTFLGVPAHVYRSALGEMGRWAASLLARRRAAAFAHELHLRFLVGFGIRRMFQRT